MNRPGIDVHLIADPNAPAPQEPSPGELGIRLVRHGMAEILEWLGEPLGPRPDELNHTTYILGSEAIVAHPDTVAMIREKLS